MTRQISIFTCLILNEKKSVLFILLTFIFLIRFFFIVPEKVTAKFKMKMIKTYNIIRKLMYILRFMFHLFINRRNIKRKTKSITQYTDANTVKNMFKPINKNNF